MDIDEIIELVRGDERLQRELINDPSIREKLYEKYNGMKPSPSDPSLPHSFWSSKHADRRTQGQTDVFRTPHRSDEGKELCS
jgi:hypothetical protein